MMQLDLFPTQLVLRKIRPEENMFRFYRMSIVPSLFGDCSLVREWGRIGTAGMSRIDLYDREADALAALDVLRRAKLRRGYCIVST